MSLVIALVIYAWERGSISAAAIPKKNYPKCEKKIVWSNTTHTHEKRCKTNGDLFAYSVPVM